ncbi:MAG: hypothetical protein P0S93_02315 [Candidatus Neptunochlamydia sp.]|nr:hypothetical protein [Candidatus Neptunochlamydia sp.]
MNYKISKCGVGVKGSEVLKMMEAKFELRCTKKGVYNRLKRRNLDPFAPRSKHLQGHRDQHEEFKNKFRDKIREAILKHIEMEDVEIWFRGGARFDQIRKKTSKSRFSRQRQFSYT